MKLFMIGQSCTVTTESLNLLLGIMMGELLFLSY